MNIVSSRKRTVVHVVKGAVQVTNRAGTPKTVTLTAGQRTVVRRKGPPRKPRKRKLMRCSAIAELKPSHWQCPGKLPSA